MFTLVAALQLEHTINGGVVCGGGIGGGVILSGGVGGGGIGGGGARAGGDCRQPASMVVTASVIWLQASTEAGRSTVNRIQSGQQQSSNRGTEATGQSGSRPNRAGKQNVQSGQS